MMGHALYIHKINGKIQHGQSQWECHWHSYQDWKLKNYANGVSW